MLVCYLALVLVGIWSSTDGALKFTEKPWDRLYLQEGSNVNLTWNYEVGNRTAELKFIIWNVYNKTQKKDVPVVWENKYGHIEYTNKALSLTQRLKKEGRASLVIKDITFEDSTIYTCILRGESGADKESPVKLIVTGRVSVTPAMIPVREEEEGGSATFTCNATAVPSQNFTWMRGEQKIVSNSKYDIASVTGSSQLTIKSISISDHGYYVCNATVNVNQPSSARAFLGVLSLKKDTDMCPKGDQYATMNKTTTICCPVRGFPPPEVTWKLPDGTVKMGNTMLPIAPEKDKDFGNYTCSAVNVGTPMGPFVISPFVISLKQEDQILPVRCVNNGKLKPGEKFVCYPVNGAVDYVFILSGKDILPDSFLGGEQNTSPEIPYSILKFNKSLDKKPDPVDVTIHVLAFKETKVIGKGKEGGFPIEIYNAAATLEVSFISVIMLFIMVIILH